MINGKQSGKSDEWYTPRYIFDSLQCRFDVDVAAPSDLTHCHVPANYFITKDSLSINWTGFVWMNPPFGGRNGITPWLDKIFQHGNGIALTPDRTSTEWWRAAAIESDMVLFITGKIKFIKPDGTLGKQPANGTTLFAYGSKGVIALERACKNGLGVVGSLKRIS